MSKYWLEKLPEGTQFVSLTPEKLLERLDEIADLPGISDCVLIYNFDLLLARLKQSERKIVWDGIYAFMKHRLRAILICIVETAVDLLPSVNDLDSWSQEDRLAGPL